jgi:hypothetical protein
LIPIFPVYVCISDHLAAAITFGVLETPKVIAQFFIVLLLEKQHSREYSDSGKGGKQISFCQTLYPN